MKVQGPAEAQRIQRSSRRSQIDDIECLVTRCAPGLQEADSNRRLWALRFRVSMSRVGWYCSTLVATPGDVNSTTFRPRRTRQVSCWNRRVAFAGGPLIVRMGGGWAGLWHHVANTK